MCPIQIKLGHQKDVFEKWDEEFVKQIPSVRQEIWHSTQLKLWMEIHYHDNMYYYGRATRRKPFLKPVNVHQRN